MILTSSLSNKELAALLNVNKTTISHVRHRRNWRHIEV